MVLGEYERNNMNGGLPVNKSTFNEAGKEKKHSGTLPNDMSHRLVREEAIIPALRRETDTPACLISQTTFLERCFPFRELSIVISADRRTRDPVYGIHRWWARRPPSLLRGLLIASHLGSGATTADFWHLFGSEERPLTGQRVLDPFAGGGSTLVEAARLGAHVVGSDVDPLAMRIVRAELERPHEESLRLAGADLLAWLNDSFSDYYPAKNGVVPLHYFYVPIVECPKCKHRGPLYRNLVLVRDIGRRGAVVRDDGLTCYCPICFSLHYFESPDAMQLQCCKKLHSIWSGTFTERAYICPECGTRSSHRELRTGVAEQRLIAVEETQKKSRRRLRPPIRDDIEAQERAQRFLASNQRENLHLPDGDVRVGHHDDRPLSYGITRYDELFTSRQLMVLGSAWQWVNKHRWNEPIKYALEMALSNSLATNNKLCGYATDYGRLSPLFAVRGYSFPALAVELNPLHPTCGRGTIAACISRIQRASRSARVRRYTWQVRTQCAVPVDLKLTTTGVDKALACHAADSVLANEARLDIDLCIFDPPYYDYIAYNDLSAFYRAWTPNSHLTGLPLLPGVDNQAELFSSYLMRCMKTIVRRVRKGRPIIFTYRSTNPNAWDAIGDAIDAACLRVTAIWPVKSDGNMGPHSHAGNSVWDLVIVCRRGSETEPHKPQLTVDQWIAAVKPLRVNEADRKNMSLAIDMAICRFANWRGNS